MYVCEPFPMFELGSVHYDRYVLNVRLPAFDEGSDVEKINTNIGKLEDLHLVVGSMMRSQYYVGVLHVYTCGRSF